MDRPVDAEAPTLTPTARGLKYLRDLGYLAGVVEKWNPHARIRQDLFGFCDIVAVPALTSDYFQASGNGTIYVQVTSGSNHAARRTKLLALPVVTTIKAAGNGVWILSFAKSKKTGRYVARVEEL